jgi:dihydroorotase
MLELSDCGAKMFTDDGSTVMDSETLRRAFDYSSVKDILISQHCEDVSLTQKFTANEGIMSFKLGLKGYPSVAEEIILSRDIMLAEYCGNRRYHASHISTAGAVEIVRNAKRKGLRVSAEATPHHFSLTDEALTSYDTSLKMNPPLRTQKDVDAVIAGLADGTIDCIASDHAPHALHEKDVEFDIAPNGIVGLETSLALATTNLLHKKVLTLGQIVEKMSVNPRKILGLEKIEVAEGNRANLTIFAPNEEWVLDKQRLKSKSKNSPFNGYKFFGKPVYAINNDKVVKSEL